VKIEVKVDPVEEAVHNGLLMERQHRVIHSEWVDWINKELGRDDLFCYFHEWTGNYVLAQWLVREPRVCVELEVLSAHPDRGGHMDLEWMRFRCVAVEEMKKRVRQKMAEAKRDRRRRQELRGVERKDKAKWLRGKGQRDLACIVESGGGAWVGDEEGGDSLAQTKEELHRMMKVI
jgi:hypothetical protein